LSRQETVLETEGLAYCAVSFGEKEAGAMYTYLHREEVETIVRELNSARPQI